MAKVVLRHVSKHFAPGETAVDDVNLEIVDREFIVLVGPSGCGKSTTLRMIAGLESISSGEIHIDDQLVNDIPPKKRDVAMVFQNYALYPHMTVYENMAFGLKLRKLAKVEIRLRVEKAATILGIEELLNRKPKALSGGQRQRVAVGRAIVRQPRVFLFDEPLSNLDAKLRVQMRAEISRLHQQLQTTMIYVTHDQVEAMTMGERIVVMKDGVIQQVATPLDLYRSPRNRFVAGFIGTPAMNLVDGVLVRDDGLWFEGATLRLRLNSAQEDRLAGYAGQQVTFGVRPEDITELGAPEASTAVSAAELNIDLVEPMGNETFLYAKAGDTPLTVRLRTEKLLRPGQRMHFCFDFRKVHFFDPVTELAL